MENENSAGGTYCCGIIRKCINKRINWASKSLFIFPIKYITRKSMDSVFPEQGYEIRGTLYRGLWSLPASLRSIKIIVYITLFTEFVLSLCFMNASITFFSLSNCFISLFWPITCKQNLNQVIFNLRHKRQFGDQ